MGRPKGSKNKKGSSKVVLTCEFCGAVFTVNNYRRNLAKYCSHKCYGKAMPIKHLGSKASNWQGGRRKTWNGYVLVYCPHHPYKDSDKYVREHRLIMEKHLGRYIKPTEVVHHINNIRDDNRITNLMLFPNQSAHGMFHRQNYIHNSKQPL